MDTEKKSTRFDRRLARDGDWLGRETGTAGVSPEVRKERDSPPPRAKPIKRPRG